MKVEELIPVVLNGQRVLTGKQIAELYETTPGRIKDNFGKNKHHFKEGIHFFKVEGNTLHALKAAVEEEIDRCANRESEGLFSCHQKFLNPLAGVSRAIIVYTAQGCVRHCKMLNSETAWRVFGELEKAYFGQDTPSHQALLLPPDDKACVYVLGLNNSSTKIGITKDILERARIIEKQSGAQVERIFNSALLSKAVALQIEKALHEKFAAHRLEGEFFNVPFVLPCRELALALADLPANAPPEVVDKFLVIAAQIQDPNSKDKILLHAANLLAATLRF